MIVYIKIKNAINTYTIIEMCILENDMCEYFHW